MKAPPSSIASIDASSELPRKRMSEKWHFDNACDQRLSTDKHARRKQFTTSFSSTSNKSPMHSPRPIATGKPARLAYKGGFPRLYHVTSEEVARKIIKDGFRDGDKSQPLPAGVWLSNQPLDGNEGAYGDTILIVQFRVPLRRLSEFEIIEEGKYYREWVMAAAFIARHATATLSRRQRWQYKQFLEA
jgi:hypothetical protein